MDAGEKAGEEVRILVGAIDELGGVPETAAGRRGGFRAAVVERLRASGWEAIPGACSATLRAWQPRADRTRCKVVAVERLG